MKTKLVEREAEDNEYIVEKVCLDISPTEYLIISAALKQFVENPANHSVDIEVAKQMRRVIGGEE